MSSGGAITNQGGVITTQQQAVINSQGNLDNTNNGLISVADSLMINTPGDIINNSGKIQAGNGINLTAQNLNNEKGSITNIGTTGTLKINLNEKLINQDGIIGGNGRR